MAVVKPFRALRPAPELAAKVAALPYDVMDSEEARLETQNNPYSFLRITKAEVDLPPGIDTHAPEVYQKARANLQQFITDKILIQDERPCFYVYKQKMDNHTQVGLAAVVSVDEYLQNTIRKHEFTRPDKEQDRIDHITTTEAQTGSVFLTYKADQTTKALLAQAMNKPPVYDFTASDGISHTLYVIDEPEKITAIEKAFAKIDVLYIADGHHRSAAAAKVAQACRAANPNYTGDEAFNKFLAVIFPDDMVHIMDYNRVIKDLNGLTVSELIAKIEDKFTVVKQPSAYKPARPHTFGMYLDGNWYQLTAKQGSYDSKDPVARLDVSILQNNLLSPILGITDPRTDKRINFVGGIRGMDELVRLVDSGKYKAAFSMFATSIKELMDIADAGQVMPPKSTWFEPKLRDAMVIHLTPCK